MCMSLNFITFYYNYYFVTKYFIFKVFCFYCMAFSFLYVFNTFSQIVFSTFCFYEFLISFNKKKHTHTKKYAKTEFPKVKINMK